MDLPRRIRYSPVHLATLVGANLVPLVGVVWWNWSVLEILVVYWLESGIIGLFNVARILLAEGEPGESAVSVRVMSVPINQDTAEPWRSVALVTGFLGLYGLFWVGHGFFVLSVLPAIAGSPGWTVQESLLPIGLAVTSMLVSHGTSFGTTYLRGGEYRDTAARNLVVRPLPRVFVLQASIVFGGLALVVVDASVALLSVFVACKTTVDLIKRRRESAQSRPSGRGTSA